MIDKITLSTFFMLLFCRCLSMEQFYREVQGSITNDRILVGYIIATFETSGFLSCAHKCLSCPSCKSYNYRPTSEERGVCEINSDEGDLEENFMNQKGSLFGRLTRKMWPRSCVDLMRSGARASTFYNIWDSKNNPYRVFCDLASEPGWAWTLVMSQSFRNRKIKQLMGVPLDKDASLNEHNPNWGAYRLSLQHMDELRVMSSHWRITCNFPTDVFDYRDYVRGNFSQVDLLNFHGHNVCKMVDYINVKGRNCSQCYAAWWQDGDTMFHHDLSLGKCFFETNANSIFNADYFGWYENVDSSFSCCVDDSSSTNHWFGGRI